MHHRIKKPDRVSARSLGLIHGRIRPLEWLFSAFKPVAEQGHANAGRVVELDLSNLITAVKLQQNFSCNDLGLPTGQQRVIRQVIEQDDELIAPQTRHRIAVTDCGDQALRNLPQ